MGKQKSARDSGGPRTEWAPEVSLFLIMNVTEPPHDILKMEK